ncbi:hypothetical protein TWF481_010374 [Arthrobotrys musiformis]|uniref:Uncharacterized protein n=1 Tax=Arthrobotrys musiformis TaxID=47236 RepID=A0AAV9W1Z1_9PEZI
MSALSIGLLKKPRVTDMQKRELLLDHLFGPEEDWPTNHRSRETVYQEMRNAAKHTYKEIIKPENPNGVPWAKLNVGLQRQAIGHLLENTEFGAFFAQTEKYWFPEYLLSSYGKSHLSSQKKKRKLADSGEGSPDAQQELSNEPLPSISNWYDGS